MSYDKRIVVLLLLLFYIKLYILSSTIYTNVSLVNVVSWCFEHLSNQIKIQQYICVHCKNQTTKLKAYCCVCFFPIT